MNSRDMQSIFFRFLVLFLFCPTFARAEESANQNQWNRLRGANGSGVAIGCTPPVELGKVSPAWKVPISPGLSSPVVSGDRIFLTAVDGERLVTIALNRVSGVQLWRVEAPEVALEKVHEASSPAASTPLVDSGLLFVYFGSYGLLCYDHDGNELWKKPIATPRNLYGMSTSPIAHKDTVILVLDNDADLPDSTLSQSRIVAFNKSTGELVWETPRPFHRSGWSTPTIWAHADGADLVVLGNERATGYDPDTGEEKWFATGFSRETIAMPIAGPEHVYFCSAQLGGGADEQPDPEPYWTSLLQFDKNGDGRIARSEMTGHFTFPLRPELPIGHPGYGIPMPSDPQKRSERLDGMLGWIDKDKDGFWSKGEWVEHMSSKKGQPILMAIRPGGKGDITDTHVVWESRRNIPEIPSPLYYDDRIYLMRNGGLLAAVDAADGSTVYRARLSGTTGQYSASPVLAGDHLYLVSNSGLVSVVRAGDHFALVSQFDLSESAYVTPAIDDSTIYFRSEHHLWAFRSGK
ncbi:MAG: PQQ-binding-like beta-propeller repeat protein [Verrucomicrobiae bacterium]|nr:PQQ-binding-like beta-propeller repeat protein [Verrucomicrobiae bacterium]